MILILLMNYELWNDDLLINNDSDSVSHLRTNDLPTHEHLSRKHANEPSNCLDAKAWNLPRDDLLKTAFTKFCAWSDCNCTCLLASSTWRDAQAFLRNAECTRPREYCLSMEHDGRLSLDGSYGFDWRLSSGIRNSDSNMKKASWSMILNHNNFYYNN